MFDLTGFVVELELALESFFFSLDSSA